MAKLCGGREISAEPSLGKALLAADGGDADAESFGAFLDTHAREVSHLDNPGLALVESGEFVEGVVELDEDLGAILGRIELVVDLEVDSTGPAAGAILAAGVIDKDQTHEVGGDAEEMGSALEVLTVLLDEFGEGLVKQSGGLEGVTGALVAEGTAGETAEFVVNDGRKRVESGLVAIAPLLEEDRDWRAGVGHF